MTPEKAIQNEIIEAIGSIPSLRIWRMNTGVAKHGKRVVRYGIPGQADITGILPDGRRLEIEVKIATGRQSKDQARFQRIIESKGGLYILARSVDDVLDRLRAEGYPDA